MLGRVRRECLGTGWGGALARAHLQACILPLRLPLLLLLLLLRGALGALRAYRQGAPAWGACVGPRPGPQPLRRLKSGLEQELRHLHRVERRTLLDLREERPMGDTVSSVEGRQAGLRGAHGGSAEHNLAAAAAHRNVAQSRALPTLPCTSPTWSPHTKMSRPLLSPREMSRRTLHTHNWGGGGRQHRISARPQRCAVAGPAAAAAHAQLPRQ